ncbi:MAG: metalloregulator ArsR/SmtB family transcription factor [Candidatus Pacebacteria bacterium]|nr:metalloregulator ArsR/SmtB family transcription factor [Candidatus Paceibacterota bacterium]
MKFDCCKTKKSKNNLDQTTEFLKVIAEPNRLKILCILRKQEKCVCEIWQFLDLPQNLISHHLKVLKDFGLIGSRKEGTKVFYFLNKKSIKKFNSLMSHFIK